MAYYFCTAKLDPIVVIAKDSDEAIRLADEHYNKMTKYAIVRPIRALEEGEKSVSTSDL